MGKLFHPRSIKGVKIPGSPPDNLFGLALRHVTTGGFIYGFHHLFKRIFSGLFSHPVLQLQRIEFWGKIQFGIQGVKALASFFGVPRTSQSNSAKHRLYLTLMIRGFGSLGTVCVSYRFTAGAGATVVKVLLK